MSFLSTFTKPCDFVVNAVENATVETVHFVADEAAGAAVAVQHTAGAVVEEVEKVATVVEDGVEVGVAAGIVAVLDASPFADSAFAQGVRRFENEKIDELESTADAAGLLGPAVVLEAALDGFADAVVSGSALLVDGVIAIGSEVVDIGEELVDSVTDLSSKALHGLGKAADWLEDQTSKAVHEVVATLGKTTETLIDEVHAAYDVVADEVGSALRAIAVEFLSALGVFDTVQESLPFAHVVGHFVDTLWDRLREAVDLGVHAIPSLLLHIPDAPFISQLRAYARQVQPSVDAAIASSGVDDLMGSTAFKGPMQLVHHLLDVTKHLTDGLQSDLTAGFPALGLAVELAAVFAPLVDFAETMLTGTHVRCDLTLLLEDILAVTRNLGTFLRNRVEPVVRTVLHGIIDSVQGTMTEQRYLPGISELYAIIVQKLKQDGKVDATEPETLSLQSGMTLAVGFAIHCIASSKQQVMRADFLEQLKSHDLPELPTPERFDRFLDDLFACTLTERSLHHLYEPTRFAANTTDDGGFDIDDVTSSPTSKGSSKAMPGWFKATIEWIFEAVELVGFALSAAALLVARVVASIILGAVGVLKVAAKVYKYITEGMENVVLDLIDVGTEVCGILLSIFSVARAAEIKLITAIPDLAVSIVEGLVVLVKKIGASIASANQIGGEKGKVGTARLSADIGLTAVDHLGEVAAVVMRLINAIIALGEDGAALTGVAAPIAKLAEGISPLEIYSYVVDMVRIWASPTLNQIQVAAD
ncbi:MAG: hypothetical protein H6736_25000 [Alphaproteobacteria bacterium]|nr:hypothetical protein [Alphaproteobacteria bacterium]